MFLRFSRSRHRLSMPCLCPGCPLFVADLGRASCYRKNTRGLDPAIDRELQCPRRPSTNTGRIPEERQNTPNHTPRPRQSPSNNALRGSTRRAFSTINLSTHLTERTPPLALRHETQQPAPLPRASARNHTRTRETFSHPFQNNPSVSPSGKPQTVSTRRARRSVEWAATEACRGGCTYQRRTRSITKRIKEAANTPQSKYRSTVRGCNGTETA